MRTQTRMAWPPLTRQVGIMLGGLFALWILTVQFTGFVQNYLLVSGPAVFEKGYVWTLLTYSFFHLDFTHLLFNGFVLWMFGSQIEKGWDPAWFWGFCLACALGGGVAVALAQLLFGSIHPTLGYSGAIMGIVAAYSWHFWNRPLRLLLLGQIRGKHLLPLFVAADLLLVVGFGQPISVSGHLGGMLTGLLLVSGYWRPAKLKLAFRRWKRWGVGGGGGDSSSRSPDRKRNGKWIN